MLALWEEYTRTHNGATQREFEKKLGTKCGSLSYILRKRMEIASIECDKDQTGHHGTLSTCRNDAKLRTKTFVK